MSILPCKEYSKTKEPTRRRQLVILPTREAAPELHRAHRRSLSRRNTRSSNLRRRTPGLSWSTRGRSLDSPVAAPDRWTQRAQTTPAQRGRRCTRSMRRRRPLAVATANVTSWPTAKTLLNQMQDDIVLVQEHKAATAQIQAFNTSRHQYLLHACPAQHSTATDCRQR